MACYRSGGCGPYEMRSCSECPASKPEYLNKKSSCKYCGSENNDFILLNETSAYSNIEMAINRQGVLRIRHYEDNNQIWFTQDIINIKFCPICGKEFKR